ncbi:MAG: hypothetical protein ACLFR7_07850 [Opitutales bacterium]
MKSAYELAMERLAADDPAAAKPVTDEQRAALAAVEQRYQAKIAEKEVFLQNKLAEARRARETEAAAQIETQLRNERARLEDEKERAKDKIRAQP